MNEFNELVPMLAPAITFLVALVTSPTASNKVRTLLAIGLSVALPIVLQALERESPDLKVMLAEIGTAFIVQLSVYQGTKGLGDLNGSLGEQGIGYIEIDE